MTLASILPVRASRAGLAALTVALLSGPAAVDAQQFFPIPGAPYSAGAISPSGATLASLGGIEGSGADVRAAATQALNQMEARLREVGLDRSHVLRVRAALAPGDGSEFAAWNEAWSAFYTGASAPARTTVGSSGVPGDARIVLDLVAAFPASAGVPAVVPGARATTNPHIQLAGPASNPTAIVSTIPGLFLSAGILGSRNGLQDPDSVEQQIRSAMDRLTNTLGDHGLRWNDVFFVRVLPTPQPGRATPDLDGWAPVYETLREVTVGHAPAFTQWAAPGFSGNGTFIEIEVWGVPQAPFGAFDVLDRTRQNPYLVTTGSPTGQIANAAMIAPNSQILWLSGVIAPEGTAPADEGMAALNLMKERVEAMGATMADVAELRVYRVEGETGFNQGYSFHFNNAENNPHRPARTNYLVESLPGGRTVEVEAILVVQPRGFF